MREPNDARIAANEEIIQLVLRQLSNEHGEPHPWDGEYVEDELAKAARRLVQACDALPPDEQPVGWAEVKT